MSVATPLLPILAMLSGEASAMDARGVSAIDQEDRLRGMLTGPMSAVADAPSPAPAAGAEAAPQDAPADPPPPPPVIDDGSPDLDADDSLLPGRRRPGIERRLPDRVEQDNPGAVRPPPPEAFPTDEFPVPDRWRLIESLGVVKEKWWDPYHQNTYKGDRPLCRPTPEEQERRQREGLPKCRTPKFLGLDGDDWFFAVNAVSDTVVEPRSFPQPVGRQVNEDPGSNDVLGRTNSLVLSQTFIVGAALIKGSTAYMPPTVEYRLTLAFNVNHVDVNQKRILFVEPTKPSHRTDHFLGVQEAFFDYHIRNTSDRYDFDSVRVGIQPFQLDFRGFLFNDNNLGIRLFGTRDNNRFQYSIGAIWRLEKDTNSGLNDLTDMPRDDFLIYGNAFRQDFPVVGLTSQAIVAWNINRERGEIHIDDNGFPVRPSLLGNLRSFNYDIVYVGYATEGRVGRINVSTQLYGAFGKVRDNFFTGRPGTVRAYFGAAELSYDHNWMRFRLSGVYASGDSDPYDNRMSGFDAVFENPIIAGADTSYWIRQSVPFVGGRVVGVNGRNGLLPSLRSSKEEGQANFNNPGLMLVGAGADFDLTPTFRLSANANHLWFQNTRSLEELRNQGTIPKSIGWDLSAAAIWRPKATQNIVFRLSGAVLEPGAGFKKMFSRNGDSRFYSILFNAILAY